MYCIHNGWEGIQKLQVFMDGFANAIERTFLIERSFYKSSACIGIPYIYPLVVHNSVFIIYVNAYALSYGWEHKTVLCS